MKRKYLMIILGALFTYLIGSTVYYAKLNYDGYCIPERRIISEAEIISTALKRVNRQKMVSLKKLNYKKVTYVPYETVEELLQKNPECCSLGLLSHETSEGRLPSPIFFDRITGLHRGYIRYRFRAKFVDENTGEEFFDQYNGSFKVSNCGDLYL